MNGALGELASECLITYLVTVKVAKFRLVNAWIVKVEPVKNRLVNVQLVTVQLLNFRL